jgi:hypothetical protein
MLVAAAVCPHPPVLIPAVMGSAGTGPEFGDLREACAAAVRALLLAQPDLLVVVGGGPADGTYTWPAAGSMQAFGVPWSTGPGEPVLPLSLTVGAWLLAAGLPPAGLPAVGPPAVQARAVAAATPPDGCLRLGAQLAALAPRVALLVMGDASARKAAGVHGAADPDAERYDAGVAEALGAADAGALARLDPGLDGELMIAGRAAWQVLAGAAASPGPGQVLPGQVLPGQVLPGQVLRGHLRYAAAPLDVGYLVASWDSVPAPAAGGLAP